MKSDRIEFNLYNIRHEAFVAYLRITGVRQQELSDQFVQGMARLFEMEGLQVEIACRLEEAILAIDTKPSENSPKLFLYTVR